MVRGWAQRSGRPGIYGAMSLALLDRLDTVPATLLNSLRDWRAPMQAEQAAGILAHLGFEDLTPHLGGALAQACKRRRPSTIAVLCRSLGRYGDQRALTSLSDVLLDAGVHSSNRAWAAWAIGAVCAPDVDVPQVVDDRAWWVVW